MIMKVNFRKFPVWSGISKKGKVIIDVAEELANVIYMNIPGVAATSLAMKIYQSDADVELDEREAGIITSAMEMFTGVFADSLDDVLKGGER